MNFLDIIALLLTVSAVAYGCDRLSQIEDRLRAIERRFDPKMDSVDDCIKRGGVDKP